MARGIQFPDQGWNPGLLHWVRRVLATGPPGSPYYFVFIQTVNTDCSIDHGIAGESFASYVAYHLCISFLIKKCNSRKERQNKCKGLTQYWVCVILAQNVVFPSADFLISSSPPPAPHKANPLPLLGSLAWSTKFCPVMGAPLLLPCPPHRPSL